MLVYLKSRGLRGTGIPMANSCLSRGKLVAMLDPTEAASSSNRSCCQNRRTWLSLMQEDWGTTSWRWETIRDAPSRSRPWEVRRTVSCEADTSRRNTDDEHSRVFSDFPLRQYLHREFFFSSIFFLRWHEPYLPSFREEFFLIVGGPLATLRYMHHVSNK